MAQANLSEYKPENKPTRKPYWDDIRYLFNNGVMFTVIKINGEWVCTLCASRNCQHCPSGNETTI